MSVRIKITLLFSVIVFFILGLLCSGIYFFSTQNRRQYIESRLSNLAITTGRYLSREEEFSQELIRKIDSLRVISFTRKSVEAYDTLFNKVYTFNDDETDSLHTDPEKLSGVLAKRIIYTKDKDRDAVYFHYADDRKNLLIVVAGYDQFGHETLRNLLLVLIGTMIAGTAGALVAGYIFSRIILIPLSRIADEVNDISAFNLSRRIDTGTSPDEWRYLAETLNSLLNRLKESFEIQSRFISNASHEISTPLTAVSSQLEVTLQKGRSPEEYKRVMESVYQDIQHLGKLTHTLLEFAKASGTKSGIEIKPFRVDEVILRLPIAIQKNNPAHSVNIDFNNLPENPQHLVVYGNEELLHTAFMNIVQNACKYSDNGQASISLKADKKEVTLTINNTGPGIPKEELENIFQPFYRVEKSRTTGSGFGLGLSLSRRIIKLHDGEISVSSKPGEQTVFTILLRHTKTN
jgi:signal transduction histidine kinase